MGHTYIIAEAGVNHNGSLEMAYELVDKAKEIGADCIKFQTFVTDLLVSEDAKLADYQKKYASSEHSQYSMLKKLELTFSEHKKIARYCDHVGIEYGSTPFDEKSLNLLVELNVPFWKVPSGDITNIPYLRRIAKFSKPIYLSTGMSELHEVANAVSVLEKAGAARDNITLLHCTTEYPSPKNDVNLLAMKTMREAFKLNVGYSDHTEGFEIAVSAVALGATIIEKHFTLDNDLDGPDHNASLNPSDFKSMVDAIRNVELALGSGIKKPAESELKNINIARKSICAKVNIEKGVIIEEKALTVKRPGNGISPVLWDFIVGTIAQRDYTPGDFI